MIMSDTNYYENTAPIISFIGCDGSGKSTLSHDIAQILNKERKTEIFYLGLGSGELGRRIQKWPIVGKYIERVLSNKAKKTRSPTERIPGPVTAFVVFLFSCKRFLEFNKMYAAHKNGIQVVIDRYPQNELIGYCDGPGLSADRTNSPIIKWLARIERQLYQKMASVHPSIIIFLDVDVETAIERKPDHNFALLDKKISYTRSLLFNGAPIKIVDARKSYGEVKNQVMSIIKMYS